LGSSLKRTASPPLRFLISPVAGLLINHAWCRASLHIDYAASGCVVRRARITGLWRLSAIFEGFDNLCAKCWQVIRAATGNQSLVYDNVLINPVCTVIGDV